MHGGKTVPSHFKVELHLKAKVFTVPIRHKDKAFNRVFPLCCSVQTHKKARGPFVATVEAGRERKTDGAVSCART